VHLNYFEGNNLHGMQPCVHDIKEGNMYMVSKSVGQSSRWIIKLRTTCVILGWVNLSNSVFLISILSKFQLSISNNYPSNSNN
jgi:hypothetical protein